MISLRRTQSRSPEDEEDEERLESFQGQRSGTPIIKLLGVLSGVTLAALVLSLVGQITGQSLLSQLFTGPLSGGPDQAPRQTNESFTTPQLPAVTEKPVVAGTPPARTETSPPKSVSRRDADRLTPRQRETRQRETNGPSEVTGTREPSITSTETSPPPKETSTPLPTLALKPMRPRRKPEPARARAATDPDSAPRPDRVRVPRNRPTRSPARRRLRRRRRKPRLRSSWARSAPSSCAGRNRGDGAPRTPCASWTLRASPWWSPTSCSSRRWPTAPWRTLRWAPSPSREPTVERCRPAARLRSIFESAWVRATNSSMFP